MLKRPIIASKVKEVKEDIPMEEEMELEELDEELEDFDDLENEEEFDDLEDEEDFEEPEDDLDDEEPEDDLDDEEDKEEDKKPVKGKKAAKPVTKAKKETKKKKDTEEPVKEEKKDTKKAKPVTKAKKETKKKETVKKEENKKKTAKPVTKTETKKPSTKKTTENTKTASKDKEEYRKNQLQKLAKVVNKDDDSDITINEGGVTEINVRYKMMEKALKRKYGADVSFRMAKELVDLNDEVLDYILQHSSMYFANSYFKLKTSKAYVKNPPKVDYQTLTLPHKKIVYNKKINPVTIKGQLDPNDDNIFIGEDGTKYNVEEINKELNVDNE